MPVVAFMCSYLHKNIQQFIDTPFIPPLIITVAKMYDYKEVFPGLLGHLDDSSKLKCLERHVNAAEWSLKVSRTHRVCWNSSGPASTSEMSRVGKIHICFTKPRAMPVPQLRDPFCPLLWECSPWWCGGALLLCCLADHTRQASRALTACSALSSKWKLSLSPSLECCNGWL